MAVRLRRAAVDFSHSRASRAAPTSSGRVTIPSLQLLEISQISQISRGIGSCVASAFDTHAYLGTVGYCLCCLIRGVLFCRRTLYPSKILDNHGISDEIASSDSRSALWNGRFGFHPRSEEGHGRPAICHVGPSRSSGCDVVHLAGGIR